MVYLHQSYSGGVAEDAVNQLKQSQATWASIQKLGRAQLGNLTDPKAANAYLTELKSDTGGDFAVLIDKKQLDKAAYAKAREAANLPNNYDEGTTYVQVAMTKQDWAKEFVFNPTP